MIACLAGMLTTNSMMPAIIRGGTPASDAAYRLIVESERWLPDENCPFLLVSLLPTKALMRSAQGLC